MGEQSTRALRGGKMEDVIFGGTAKRRQTGYAEVSLVLDNTGHLFDHGGERGHGHPAVLPLRGERVLHQPPLRAASRTSTSCSWTPAWAGRATPSSARARSTRSCPSSRADRREVFEEAAGISRYRHRKEEAERKLERTDENLVRVNDKIAELELQVEPLREQSEKAKKVLVLRDELRGLEISVWLDTLERLRASHIKLDADYQEAARQKEEAQAAQERLYAAAEALLRPDAGEGRGGGPAAL